MALSCSAANLRAVWLRSHNSQSRTSRPGPYPGRAGVGREVKQRISEGDGQMVEWMGPIRPRPTCTRGGATHRQRG